LTASAVIGSECTRAPTALKMALASWSDHRHRRFADAGGPFAVGDDADDDGDFRHLAHPQRAWPTPARSMSALWSE
jgi:hypothetical protein